MYNHTPRRVPTHAIDPSSRPWHARAEVKAEDVTALAKSMRADAGADHPISVRESTHPDFQWEVIAGRLRLLAAIQLGLPTVEVVIRDVTDAEAHVISLRENEGRRGLPHLEIGWAAMKALLETGSQRKELAERVGISQQKMSEVCRFATAIPETMAEELARDAKRPLSAISELPRPMLRSLKKCDEAIRRLRLIEILAAPREEPSSGTREDPEGSDVEEHPEGLKQPWEGASSGTEHNSVDSEVENPAENIPLPREDTASGTGYDPERSNVDQLAADIRRLALHSKLKLVWLILIGGIRRS